jgi:hypothetical protein
MRQMRGVIALLTLIGRIRQSLVEKFGQARNHTGTINPLNYNNRQLRPF